MRVCARCRRRVPAARESCLYCGGAPTGAEKDPDIACPKCHVTMTRFLEAGLVLDACPQCESHWFDRGELEALLTSRGRSDQMRPFAAAMDPRPTNRPMYVPCPRCQKLMHRRGAGQGAGVVADVCQRHGVFLERHEVDRLDTVVAAKFAGPRPPERFFGRSRPPLQEAPPMDVAVRSELAAELIAETISGLFEI